MSSVRVASPGSPWQCSASSLHFTLQIPPPRDWPGFSRSGVHLLCAQVTQPLGHRAHSPETFHRELCQGLVFCSTSSLLWLLKKYSQSAKKCKRELPQLHTAMSVPPGVLKAQAAVPFPRASPGGHGTMALPVCLSQRVGDCHVFILRGTGPLPP